jgi:hypothetical protein
MITDLRMDVRRGVICLFQAGPEFLFPLPQLGQALLDAFVVKTILDRVENAFHELPRVLWRRFLSDLSV